MEQMNTKAYWGSIEELQQIADFQTTPGKEFVAPPMKQEATSMERRTFLKLMGASALAASISCSRRPVEKIIPYVHKPEEITPGIANWYASTCGECSAACGTLIKTREGRPIKIEGNKKHPLSGGGLCARGQASLLNLYDPDRLREPAAVDRRSGEYTATTWELLDRSIQGELQKLKESSKKVVIFTDPIVSPSTKALIDEFLIPYRGLHIAYSPLFPEELLEANSVSFGERKLPQYRLDRAELLVSFGADFLGTWISPVEFARQFSKARRVDEGKMLRFVAIEAALSLSGTNADEYIPVAAGDELFVALALAHELIVRGGKSAYAGNPIITEVLRNYSIERVAKTLKLETAQLQHLATQLWKSRGKSLLLGGPVHGKYGRELQIVLNLLNSALMNDGATIDWDTATATTSSSYRDIVKLVEEMKQEKVGAVILASFNPAFVLPQTLGFADALKQVPLVIDCSDKKTETTQAATTQSAPMTHALEMWNDAEPAKGLYSIAQPVISPLYQNRSFQDSLIRWGAMNAKNWYSYLQTWWQKNVHRSSESFARFWEKALHEGFVDHVSNRHDVRSSSRNFSSSALSGFPEMPKPGATLTLALVPSLAIFDGRYVNNSWLQELPDPLSKITWENYLSLSPATAERMGISQGEVIEIEAGEMKAKLPVHIQPKLSPSTMMVSVGYGQSFGGSIGGGTGVNVYPLQKGESSALQWNGIDVNITTTGKKVDLAVTQGHHNIENRPIVFEATWEEFQKDPSSGIEHPHLLTMWKEREYPKERWGMAIDMTACTGCNACVVACQAENNVPVVGKDQVLRGREMHWLRVDRYYTGDLENPDTYHQPMPCQQCEAAPCETVCPVLATFHSDDGLNMMTYNRCVGTRYCSNNCPYKVRRFNFFEYSENFEEPQQLALNPDVTVRTRGVMEKCTFCIQRVQEKRHEAKLEGRELKDGEIQTACQQSCPAQAIVFGNLNDPKSEVSKRAASKRGYHVLADLNTRPSVTYLSKIRNKA